MGRVTKDVNLPFSRSAGFKNLEDGDHSTKFIQCTRDPNWGLSNFCQRRRCEAGLPNRSGWLILRNCHYFDGQKSFSKKEGGEGGNLMVCICTLKSTPPFPRKTAPLPHPGSLSCSAFGQPPGDAADRSPFFLLLLHPMERAPGTRQKANSRLRQPPLLLSAPLTVSPSPFPTEGGWGAEAVCVCLQGGSRPINQGRGESVNMLSLSPARLRCPLWWGPSIVPQHMEAIVILPGGKPLPGRRQLGRFHHIQPGSFVLKWPPQTDRASCFRQLSANRNPRTKMAVDFASL